MQGYTPISYPWVKAEGAITEGHTCLVGLQFHRPFEIDPDTGARGYYDETKDFLEWWQVFESLRLVFGDEVDQWEVPEFNSWWVQDETEDGITWGLALELAGQQGDNCPGCKAVALAIQAEEREKAGKRAARAHTRAVKDAKKAKGQAPLFTI